MHRQSFSVLSAFLFTFDQIRSLNHPLFIPSFCQLSNKSSHALHHLIPPRKLLTEYSPVNELKAVKNVVEVAGMRKAHVSVLVVDPLRAGQIFCVV